MADNVTTQSTTLATIPASTKISTDEDATNGHVQRMKIAYSADGVSTHAQVDADGVLVNLGANNDVTVTSGTIDLGATDNAVLDSIDTATTAIQAAVEGTVTVDLGANNDVTVTSGAITETNSTAILADTASMDTNLGTLAGAVAGTEIQVDIVADGAGLATAANQSTANTSLSNIEAGVAAEAAALGSGVLIQGDDGTDRKNINVDATTGDVQVDVTNTVTVDLGANNDVTVTGTVTEANSAAILVDTTAIIAGQLADGHNVTVDNAAGASAVNIQDGGNSITVDGTIDLGATDNAVLDSIATATAATQAAVEGTLTVGSHAVTNAGTFATQATLQTAANTVGKVHITDGSNDATIRNLAANDALNVAIVDAAGDQIVSFSGSGGTSAVDDAAFTAASDSGTPVMGFVTADTVDSGDVGVLGMTTDRELKVAITSDDVGIGGGTQYSVDDAAPTVVTMAGAIRDDSLTTLTEVDGDATLLRVSSTGALHVTGGGGGTEYTTNDAAPANPIGTATLVERDDALSALTEIEGDWTNLRGSAEGALWVQDANSDAILASVFSLANNQLADGHNVTVDNASIAVTSAAALDVSAATVTVDLGLNNDVTVTGTVDLGATDNAVLDSIDAAVNGTLTVGSHAVTNAGTFTVQEDGAALTALQLIDDTVVTLGTDTYAEATTKANVIGAVRNDTLATLASLDNEIAPLQVNASGALYTDSSDTTQPVSAASLPLPTGAASETTLDAIKTAVELLDNVVSGSEAQVDVVTSALPTGASTAANQSTGNASLSNIEAAVAAEATALGSGILLQGDDGTDRKNVNVDATTGDLQVDVTNTVTVDGSGVTQPVSGTVTANLSATDNAVLDSIQTAVETIDNAISGSEMQVDVVAALPAGDNNIGNVDIASSVALDVSAATVTVDLGVNNDVTVTSGTVTANLGATDNAVLDSIDSAVNGTLAVDLGANNDVTVTGNVAHDAADSGNPIKTGGIAKSFDGTAPGTAVAENDRVNSIYDPEGRQYVNAVHPNYFHVSADYASAQTNATLKAAPGAGLKIYITDLKMSNGATAGEITILDGSGGTELDGGYFAINGGMTTNQVTPIALTANTLCAVTSVTVTTHRVTISGFIAP